MLMEAVVVCVVCAQFCVRCIGGAFGCLSSPLWAWVGGYVWVWGLCVVAPLPPWLVVVCSPAVPFACPPPSFSVPHRLAHCSPGALSGSFWAVPGVLPGWVGGGRGP